MHAGKPDVSSLADFRPWWYDWPLAGSRSELLSLLLAAPPSCQTSQGVLLLYLQPFLLIIF